MSLEFGEQSVYWIFFLIEMHVGGFAGFWIVYRSCCFIEKFSFFLCDTAGSVELAAVGVSVSVFNLVSKLFNVPLLNVTTSFIAEEQALVSMQNESSIQVGQGIHSSKDPSRSILLMKLSCLFDPWSLALILYRCILQIMEKGKKSFHRCRHL